MTNQQMTAAIAEILDTVTKTDEYEVALVAQDAGFRAPDEVEEVEVQAEGIMYGVIEVRLVNGATFELTITQTRMGR